MKRLTLCVLFAAISLSLAGCGDSKEISRTAFVMAIGFDTNEYGEKTFTFQTANPSAYEEGSEEEPYFTSSVKAKTLYSAMDKLNSDVAKKLDCSHIKLALFSKEYLEKGISDEITAMLKSPAFHPNTRIAAVEKTSADYLAEIEIPPDSNPAEYYENLFNTDYTLVIPDVRLKDMVNKYDTSVCANVLPVVSLNGTKDTMAILKNYRLSSFADTGALLNYNLLAKDNYKGDFYINLPKTDKYAVTELKVRRKSIKMDFSDKIPVVNVYLRLDGNTLWSEKSDKYSAQDEKLNEMLKNKIEKNTKSFLDDCSRKYKADILNISRFARKKYPTVRSWEKEDWQGLFEKAKYNVNVVIGKIN